MARTDAQHGAPRTCAARMPTSCDARGELTPRAREVLRTLATGLSNEEAARALFVSPRTVHEHLWRAYRALGVHNLQSALLAAGIVRVVESPSGADGVRRQ